MPRKKPDQESLPLDPELENLPEDTSSTELGIVGEAAPGPVLLLENGHDIEIKKTRRDITLKLTDFQVADAAKKAANAAGARAIKDGELSSIKSRYKADIEALDSEVSDNLKIVRTGAEVRTLDIVDRYDYTDGVVRTVWAGEVVETRPVTFEERQQGIKFIDKKDAVKGDDEQPGLFEGAREAS